MSETRFYLFRQNNSGGSFDIDDTVGIGPRVWIEAESYHAAIEKAQSIGIYFDGVEAGTDCECCGDRWSEPWDEKGFDMFKINSEYDFSWWNCVYVHFISGQIERINKDTLGQRGLS